MVFFLVGCAGNHDSREALASHRRAEKDIVRLNASLEKEHKRFDAERAVCKAYQRESENRITGPEDSLADTVDGFQDQFDSVQE